MQYVKSIVASRRMWWNYQQAKRGNGSQHSKPRDRVRLTYPGWHLVLISWLNRNSKLTGVLDLLLRCLKSLLIARGHRSLTARSAATWGSTPSWVEHTALTLWTYSRLMIGAKTSDHVHATWHSSPIVADRPCRPSLKRSNPHQKLVCGESQMLSSAALMRKWLIIDQFVHLQQCYYNLCIIMLFTMINCQVDNEL